MNILLINHYAGSPEYGMEFRPYYFAKKWVQLGHNVTILSASYTHIRYKQPIVKDKYHQYNIDNIKYVLKTHSILKQNLVRSKIITTIRDPRDVCLSFKKFYFYN